MSMNYCAAFGFYLKMDDVASKLSSDSALQWDKIKREESPFEVIEELPDSLVDELNQIFGNQWVIVFFDEESDTSGSEFLEEGEFYIALEYETLYDMKPNKLMKHLNDVGLAPKFDTVCCFG